MIWDQIIYYLNKRCDFDSKIQSVPKRKSLSIEDFSILIDNDVLSKLNCSRILVENDHNLILLNNIIYLYTLSAMKRQSYVSAFVFACQFSFTYILIAITIYFGKDMMINNQITPFDYLRLLLHAV